MDTLDERTKASAEELMKYNKDITKQTIEGMIHAFRVLDRNRNNCLEKEEVIKALQILGSNPTETEITNIMNKLDTSGDGKVDMAEYFHLARHVKVGKAETEDLTRAFKVFDKDGNGKICKRELTVVLKSLDQYKDDEEVNMMMEGADLDGDGYLDIKELVKLFHASS